MFLQLISLVALICLQQGTAHVTLAYPPARRYPFDFLVSKMTGEQCGNMKYRAPLVHWKVGSKVNITWYQAYVHDGGYEISLFEKGKLVKKLVEKLDRDTKNENRAEVQLPAGKVCNPCVIQMKRAVKSLKLNLVSCADVRIQQTVPTAKKCMNKGTPSSQSTRCKCPHARFRGRQCQYEDECATDADCSNQGKCEAVASETAPMNKVRQCFCDPGFFGKKCNKKSALKCVEVDKKKYHYKKLLDNPLTELYYRAVVVTGKPTERKETTTTTSKTTSKAATTSKLPETTEATTTMKQPSKPLKPTKAYTHLEVVMVSKTKSWLSVGWKPKGLNAKCLDHPIKMSANKSSMAYDMMSHMHCLDLVIGAAKGDRSRVRDYWSRGKSSPLPDDEIAGGRDSITAAAGCEQGDSTMMFFQKRITPSGKTDHVLARGDMTIAWALGHTTPGCEDKKDLNDDQSEDQIRYHGKCRGHANLNLIKTPPSAANFIRYSAPLLCTLLAFVKVW